MVKNSEDRLAMFEKPTINDFLDNVRWHLEKCIENAGRGVNAVLAQLAAKGLVQSGRAVLSIFDVVQKEFDTGIEKTFGELKRTIKRTDLDRKELRQAAIQCLENFLIAMKALARADQYRALAGKAVDEKLVAMDRHLAFFVRQFDTGFFDPNEPEEPKVNNSINIGNMTGSAIQQGSPGGNQSVQFSLKVDEAKAAVAAFETAVQSAGISGRPLDEIAAEMRTISAQLSKASPSLSILQEAGRSLRNVVEGIAAAMLVPSVQATAPALWAALGIG